MVDATVTLYKDIGLDSNYNRTMLFDTKTQQTNWFNSISTTLKLTLTNVNYNKIQNALYVHEQFGDIYGYSYVRLQDIDDSGRTYYGFISGVTLVDDETTRFDIVIDTIQTFMCEWELGNCMVYKEHIDRWSDIGSEVRYVRPNSEGVNTYYTSNTPQLINYGVTDERRDILVGVVAFTSDRDYTTVSATEGSTTKDRLYFGLVPLSGDDIDKTYKCNIHYTIQGSGDDVTGDYNYPTFREFVSGNLPIQMNILPEAIIGMWVLPLSSIPINESNDIVNFFTASTEQEYTVDGVPVEPIRVWTSEAGVFPAEAKSIMTIVPLEDMISAFNNGQEFKVEFSYPEIPEDGDTALPRHEPALYMYPYKQRYITTKDGSILMTIPDNVFFNDTQSGRTATSTGYEFPVTVFTNIKTTAPQNQIAFGKVGVNRSEVVQNGYSGAVALDTAVSVDVMNDEWYTYCRTQRDSDRKMMWTSIATNTINQMVFMGYGGALVGSRSNSGANDPMKGGTVDFGGKVGNLSRAMVGATTLAVGASLITSTVQGYQMWQQQEAKEQTIRNQPSQLLSMSDGYIPIVCESYKYYANEIDCDLLTANNAFNSFKYFGYTVNRMEVPNIKSRKYYNYICTTYTTIKGALPADIKQDLVNIFEKGITFFHADNCSDTNYPTTTGGNAELENIERSLLS